MKKTFVLLHGAWHGAWSWMPVARVLQARGHEVICPTQTGLGERAHLASKAITLDVFIEEIVSVLEGRDLENVTLVGHSFGATVAIGLADRVARRIDRLVFLDGILLRDGETALGLLPPALAKERLRQAELSSGGVTIPAPSSAAFGVDSAIIADIDRKLTPHPLGTYTSPLRLQEPWGNGVPMTYIACVRPDYPPVLLSRARAQAADMHFITLPEGHDAMLTAPEAVAALLDDAR